MRPLEERRNFAGGKHARGSKKQQKKNLKLDESGDLKSEITKSQIGQAGSI
jgi:hypothetical protein